VFFHLDPERAHSISLRLLGLAGSLPPLRALLRRLFAVTDPGLRVRAFGLEFPNPLGLAAGYDKDGRAMYGLACLGFGHLELGTVTPRPQAGNPRPRVFRLKEDRALINRMGFPNAGAEALLRRLRRGRPRGVVIGVNIGKGADTPLERAKEDYLSLMRSFYAYADYLVVNVSSPNTIGLRRLQARRHLQDLLSALVAERANIRSATGRQVPMLVKLAPDLTDAELEEAVGGIAEAGLDGVVATNTTLERTDLKSGRQHGAGGLSGAPLRGRSTQMVRRVYQLTGGQMPIIGVGGIFGPDDAREKLEAGASLVQVFTGLVFQGPGLARDILQALRMG
jgi:dihydroorotate dehydrogenase